MTPGLEYIQTLVSEPKLNLDNRIETYTTSVSLFLEHVTAHLTNATGNNQQITPYVIGWNLISHDAQQETKAHNISHDAQQETKAHNKLLVG
jgi:hypothetical protein